MIASNSRLRKHADYQQVYKAGRRHFGGHSAQINCFFLLRTAHVSPASSPVADPVANAARVGLTVSKAMGGAVDRNRIKRRMRAAVRKQLPLLSAPVDVVLHPRRSVIDTDFVTLEREVAAVFRAVQQAVDRRSPGHASPARMSATL
jgi:ribonuclease P protein component